LAPLAEGQVGGDGDAGLFAFGEDLEQQLGAAAVELHVAELVEAQQVEAAVAGDEPREAPLVGGFDELVDELGGGGVTDPTSFFAGGDAEPDEEVALAGAGVAEEDDGFAGVEVAAAGEGGDRGRIMEGAAARSKSVRRFTRGNRASLMRRWRRRSPRSSTSAERISAKNAR
jgi:hypothetical protein